ncbi:hypothetical protein RclHR1_02480002 [Rhizophagus clarus]|uniref:Protein kinase domain-containing protein n=1 Tax=Rhizophagus clarus TaxID=94130 RepID=A0A2Z6QY30_9GLOM|nr:hypothetical protein RclHR1_02480002 [Rhizophagus clarus]
MESIEGVEFSAQAIIDTIEAIKRVESLNNTEKSENLKKANDILRDIIKEKQCRKCQNICDNLNSCEFCIRNYLVSRFEKWTSENEEIDEWIESCQKKIRRPDHIIEWIPYSNLQDIQYTSEGGMYHKMKALWTEGRYTSWDFKYQELKRFGPHYVTIKNVSMNNPNLEQSLQEIKAHLLLTSTMSPVIRIYGLTRDGNDDYMIITENVSYTLKSYLKDNIHTLSWVTKYRILQNILESLASIHNKKFIHGDLHSGIIRLSTSREIWLIGDLRYCRSVDNPSEVSFGTMPYVAPEMLKGTTEKMTISSDIYSFGMVMWEVSTGRQPFDEMPTRLLSDEIVSGSRPKIMEGTPSHYANLMIDCWKEDPLSRPSLAKIQSEISKTLEDYFKDVMSPQEQEEMREINFLKTEFVAASTTKQEYVSKPNQGRKDIEIIKYDQIEKEEFFDGVGRISFGTMSERRVAIKTLQINKLDKTKERMNSILSELLQQKISRWDHIYQDKNIVEFLGVGIKDEKNLFLVMPFANNGNLRKYIKNNKLPFGEKLEVAKGIVNGIKVLHNNNIVHGNINPDNILIFDKVPKISNLPLPFENKDLKSKDLYICGELFNNIGYVDPNSFLESSKSHKKDNYPVDIYSLGTLLWEIMSEKVPYRNDGVLI